MSPAEREFADAIGHATRCRADVLAWYEHPTHQGAVSLMACQALDAIKASLEALRAGLDAFSDFDCSDDAETVAAILHDMASDVTGRAQARMEREAYNPHAERSDA